VEQGASATTSACPNCGSSVPITPGFSQWCETCGWNLDPLGARKPPPNRIRRLWQRLGASASESLERELLDPTALRPKLTVSKALAYLLSLAVFGLAALFSVAGLLLLPLGLVWAILGVVLVGLAFLARPRFGRVPSNAVAADGAPKRFRALADRIAKELGTRPADFYLFDSDYNAAVTELGLRRRRVLFVGLPLMAVLAPQERVAVLGHEFGHFVNGDPRRGFVGHTALATLIEWHKVLVPRSLMDVADEGIPGLLMFPVNVVMFTVSMVPYGLAALLVTLMRRSTQRAEYLADARAAELAGSRDAVAAFDKLLLAGPISAAMMATTDEHWQNQSLWDDLQKRAANFPERELERYRRIDREQGGRLDDTHPPTESRKRVIQERPQTVASQVLGHGENEAIDEELRNLTTRIQRDVIDTYVDSLRA
jgi:Zn-dependent protease with chaperone function